MNEYWIVTEKKTGKIICNCGDINDAIMMVSLDPNNRNYSKKTFLIDQVIDVTSTTDKQLSGQIGLPFGFEKINEKQFNELPENTQKPIIVS